MLLEFKLSAMSNAEKNKVVANIFRKSKTYLREKIQVKFVETRII